MKDLDNVLYTDNHILVGIKPAGQETQGEFHDNLKLWIKRVYNKPGAVFLEPVHRLDQPVSGLVLFARTSKALSRLQKAFREKQWKKTYHVETVPPLKGAGTLEHFIEKGDRRAHIVSNGKLARLHYEGPNKIVLDTGRYHQIRAQLSHIGHPIKGDVKYGGPRSRKEGISLRHVRLEGVHPVTQSPLLFEIA